MSRQTRLADTWLRVEADKHHHRKRRVTKRREAASARAFRAIHRMLYVDAHYRCEVAAEMREQSKEPWS